MTDSTDMQTPNPETDNIESSPSMGSSIMRSVWGLSLFAIITAGLIAVTQVGTKDQIEYQIKQARSKALLEVVPLNSFNNDLLEDAFVLNATEGLGLVENSEAFVATQDGLPTHIVLPVVAPEGYSGPIRLILSVNMSGEIAGVRVIEHKETPGLGDKIDIKKSDWIVSFNGKSLDNTEEAQWKVKKDGGEFDQLTGATITPRAIVGAVYQALIYFRDNKDGLIAQALSNKPVDSANKEPGLTEPASANE